MRLDGNLLSTEQIDDPTTSQYVNEFAIIQELDSNIDLALTLRDHYLSYGMHNVNKGAISSGDVFRARKASVSVAQAGYRHALR